MCLPYVAREPIVGLLHTNERARDMTATGQQVERATRGEREEERATGSAQAERSAGG